VPITAKTKEQAIAQAKVIAANQDADIAEFRIDLLEFAAIQTSDCIRSAAESDFKRQTFIATIRTQ
jgi:3-dehydroquinate dehydratase-1